MDTDKIKTNETTPQNTALKKFQENERVKNVRLIIAALFVRPRRARTINTMHQFFPLRVAPTRKGAAVFMNPY